jgi:hypothetical protein
MGMDFGVKRLASHLGIHVGSRGLGCSAGVTPGGQSILAQASLSLLLKMNRRKAGT